MPCGSTWGDQGRSLVGVQVPVHSQLPQSHPSPVLVFVLLGALLALSLPASPPSLPLPAQMWSRWPLTGSQAISTSWMTLMTGSSSATRTGTPVSHCWTWSCTIPRELHWTQPWGESWEFTALGDNGQGWPVPLGWEVSCTSVSSLCRTLPTQPALAAAVQGSVLQDTLGPAQDKLLLPARATQRGHSFAPVFGS